MAKGELVPDDVVVRMVTETLADHPEGFILDGFPRTIAQAEALERALDERGTPLTSVLAIGVEDDLAVKRVAGRRTCAACGRPANVEFRPPAVAGRCDACGGELVQRPDDEESVVRVRLGVYRDQTRPLLNYYGQRGLLREIDGDATEDEVTARAAEALGESATARGGAPA
jgi:adenylate kinase